MALNNGLDGTDSPIMNGKTTPSAATSINGEDSRVFNGGSTDQQSQPVLPVAIVGMGMGLPGSVSTADDFWNFLLAGKDGRSRVPESRYNINSYHDPGKRGGIRTEHGQFLQEDPGMFDRISSASPPSSPLP